MNKIFQLWMMVTNLAIVTGVWVTLAWIVTH